jgi:hypothetical protein
LEKKEALSTAAMKIGQAISNQGSKLGEEDEDENTVDVDYTDKKDGEDDDKTKDEDDDDKKKKDDDKK